LGIIFIKKKIVPINIAPFNNSGVFAPIFQNPNEAVTIEIWLNELYNDINIELFGDMYTFDTSSQYFIH
jgi:hypothetical protein